MNYNITKSWGKVAVALRCGRAADPVFLQCWTRFLLGGLRQGDVVLEPVVECLSHYAAETLAKRFMETEADSILFMDDDMVFDPGDLTRLRDGTEGQRYDVLQGLCVSRSPPHQPIVWLTDEEAERNTLKDGGVVGVNIVGLAFTLIRRDVLIDLREQQATPTDMWFAFGLDWRSEDVDFSRKAKTAGFTLATDADVVIGHRFPIVAKWDKAENAVRFESTAMKKGH